MRSRVKWYGVYSTIGISLLCAMPVTSLETLLRVSFFRDNLSWRCRFGMAVSECRWGGLICSCFGTRINISARSTTVSSVLRRSAATIMSLSARRFRRSDRMNGLETPLGNNQNRSEKENKTTEGESWQHLPTFLNFPTHWCQVMPKLWYGCAGRFQRMILKHGFN